MRRASATVSLLSRVELTPVSVEMCRRSALVVAGGGGGEARGERRLARLTRACREEPEAGKRSRCRAFVR